jgi:hypothetical protein
MAHRSNPRSPAAAARSALRRLERITTTFGGDAASRKRALLEELEHAALPDARSVLRLHESLCFLAAFPDDASTLRVVERLLRSFDRRSDLRRLREALADTGLAGTPIRYAFYWATARWLARRWPDRLQLDWPAFEPAGVERLERLLPLLCTHGDAPALDELDFTPRQWLARLRAPGEGEAACLVRLFERVAGDDFWREREFESLDVPFVLLPDRATPSRTRSRSTGGEIHFQRAALDRGRPDLAAAVRRPPSRIRALGEREGRRLIDLARSAMVTRSRDLDAFANADARDVRLVDYPDALTFACIGVRPSRRLLLESVYGFLTLKNGVPIGYVLISALLDSAEVAYNVFETFRRAESARVYGAVLSMAHHLFGADTFVIDPYQLGQDNDEGLRSGAWWFYYKLGFRPRDAGVRRLARTETARMRREPGHRSSLATMRELVAAPLFWRIGREREDVLGRFPLGRVGLAVTRYLSRRFGGRRREGLSTCAVEAAALLGLRSMRGFSAGEREAWERAAPLVLCLPGVSSWSLAERRELARVVRAKGGRRESDYVALADRHRKLRAALVALARGAGSRASRDAARSPSPPRRTGRVPRPRRVP